MCILRSFNLIPCEVLIVSINMSKKRVSGNLFLGVISWIIIVINAFFPQFELESPTVNNTDSDGTILNRIHGNLHTWKGCHIFDWNYGSHKFRIEMNLEWKNIKGYNRIIILASSISNNYKFIFFGACTYILNDLQVVGYAII